jgi:hypothetical protein
MGPLLLAWVALLLLLLLPLLPAQRGCTLPPSPLAATEAGMAALGNDDAGTATVLS